MLCSGMAVRQPCASTDSDTRRVTFTVEVSAEHAPSDLTYIDRARRAVLDADEDTVTVTPVTHRE